MHIDAYSNYCKDAMIMHIIVFMNIIVTMHIGAYSNYCCDHIYYSYYCCNAYYCVDAC